MKKVVQWTHYGTVMALGEERRRYSVVFLDRPLSLSVTDEILLLHYSHIFEEPLGLSSIFVLF